MDAMDSRSADAAALREEAYCELVEQIRGQSAAGRLIASEVVCEALSDLELGDAAGGGPSSPVADFLVMLRGREEFQDIRSTIGSNGVIFFYSTAQMTPSYARIQARVEVGDELATIAATVRDESLTYPRPTAADLFLRPPFSVRPEDLGALIARLGRTEAYKDIKVLRASTGAFYLYSSEHLDGDLVKLMVEDAELGIERV